MDDHIAAQRGPHRVDIANVGDLGLVGKAAAGLEVEDLEGNAPLRQELTEAGANETGTADDTNHIHSTLLRGQDEAGAHMCFFVIDFISAFAMMPLTLCI
ncbi:hypothetical protein [Acidimangrovimonas pyrenivorans]|uniref:Uncharacterized protein n=1 Tax=Acidimangrovimonas pyrenivorans TaxID=2030798 RepID=A0ABV7AME7_9RHOB